jgi:hypothetical protein
VIRVARAGFDERNRALPRPTLIATVRSLRQGAALPPFPLQKWRHSMRKIMSLGIAAMLALVAVGTWAVATAGSQNHDGPSGTRINAFELMMNSKDLPTQQYDMS